MKNNLKIIKVLLIVAIIVIIITVILLVILSKKDNNDENDSNYLEGQEIHDDKPHSDYRVTVPSSFVAVENCIKKYYDNKDNKENLLSLLSEEFIKKNDIINYINEPKGEITAVDIIEHQDSRIYSYSVKCLDDSYKEYYFIVLVDMENKTFVIEPIIGIEKLEDINLVTEIKSIPNKTINIFEYVLIRDKDMAVKYYNFYKKLMLNNSEMAFALLDSSYKEKRFNNDIKEFKEYVELKRAELNTNNIVEYSSELKKEYKEYVLKDTTGVYITIKEKSIMNFEIMLDQYTILSDKFIEKYKELNDSEKISTNVELIFLMLNNNDYRSIYNKLNNEFRNSNFNTIDKFKNYVKKNFYSYNVYEVNNVKQEGDICIYNITIKNADRVSANKKNMTIIMQIKEGTDFVMSFSFN